MELDELKNTWTALDERLKQNESLNTRIVKEMLETKSNKSLSRILRTEIFGAVVLLLVTPLIVWLFVDSKFHLNDKTSGIIFLIFMFFFCLAGFLWQALKVHKLMKIDPSSVVSDNIRIMNKYNIWIKKEKLAVCFLIPLICFSCIYLYVQLNAALVLWVFMLCILVVNILITYYQYKRIYDKNINSILKSLDELKELDEE